MHRRAMDGSRYPGSIDPTGLRPATVEELAAQERVRPSRLGRGRRPAVIAAATCAVLLAGAGAFALAHADPEPKLVEPYGEAAPFGVGYVDGFGEHSPKPPRKPRPATSTATRQSRSSSPSPEVTVTVVAVKSLSIEATRLPAPQEPSPSSQPRQAQASAVYWTNAWHDDRYITYVWVSNDSPEPLDWQVDVRLPDGATVDASTAANRRVRDGVWTFTSTQGLLRAWHVYLFAFSGTRDSSRFTMRSCEVNGVACRPFM